MGSTQANNRVCSSAWIRVRHPRGISHPDGYYVTLSSMAHDKLRAEIRMTREVASPDGLDLPMVG